MRTIEQVRDSLTKFLVDSIYPHVPWDDLDRKESYLSGLLDEFERVKTEYVYDDIRSRLEGIV